MKNSTAAKNLNITLVTLANEIVKQSNKLTEADFASLGLLAEELYQTFEIATDEPADNQQLELDMPYEELADVVKVEVKFNEEDVVLNSDND